MLGSVICRRADWPFAVRHPPQRHNPHECLRSARKTERHADLCGGGKINRQTAWMHDCGGVAVNSSRNARRMMSLTMLLLSSPRGDERIEADTEDAVGLSFASGRGVILTRIWQRSRSGKRDGCCGDVEQRARIMPGGGLA